MSKNLDEVMYGCIGIIVIAVVLIIGGTILSGWALSVMWAWYITPVFGLPILGVKNAILLASLISYFTPIKLDDENKTRNEKVFSSIFLIIFKPIFYVAWFWIILNWS